MPATYFTAPAAYIPAAGHDQIRIGVPATAPSIDLHPSPRPRSGRGVLLPPPPPPPPRPPPSTSTPIHPSLLSPETLARGRPWRPSSRSAASSSPPRTRAATSARETHMPSVHVVAATQLEHDLCKVGLPPRFFPSLRWAFQGLHPW